MQLTGKRMRVPEHVLVRELQGESVLLNLQREAYFGLDEIGTRMWAALTAMPDLEAAARLLEDEYEVDPGQLRADLAAFIGELREAGLVEIDDP